MSKIKKKPILCGGMLLSLLCKTKNDVAPAHDKVKSVSYENSDEDIFKALIKVLFDDFTVGNAGSFKTITNEYKICKNNGMRYFPFRNANDINAISSTPLSSNMVWKMGELIRNFITYEKRQELLNAVVELLEESTNINETYGWHISENKEVSIKDIRDANEIYIDWLLCDVWRYIVIYSKENKHGLDSYLDWFGKVDEDDGKYHFVSNIGFNRYKEFIIKEITNEPIAEEVMQTKTGEPNNRTVDYEKFKSDEPPYIPGKILEEKILKSGQVLAEALGNAIKNLELGMVNSSEPKEPTEMLYISKYSENELFALLYNGDIEPIQIDKPFSYSDVYGNEYFEFTEECYFSSTFGGNMRRCVEVRIPMNGYEIVGRTSPENWKSQSYMNNILFAGTCRCNGIFQIISKNDNMLIVQFIYLRR